MPGLHGSAALFEGFLALAPPWARCRVATLPDAGEQTFDALASALAPPLKALERMVIVAESYSGPVAARLTGLLAGKVALLVLCNPLTEVPLRFPSRLAARVMRWERFPAWPVAFLMSGGDRSLARAVLRETRAMPLETLARRVEAAQSAVAADLAARLGGSAPPLLTILGTSDRLVSPRTGRRVLGLPESALVELSGPHLIVQARPADVWVAISGKLGFAA